MPVEKIPTTKKRENFLNIYGDLDDKELLIEIAYAQSLQIEKLEKIRSNTSMLVWWLVAIPVLFFVIVFFFGGLGALI